MALEVEVIKIEYPDLKRESYFTCTVNDRSNGTSRTLREEIQQGGSLLFNFAAFSKLSKKAGLDFQISSKDGSIFCSSLAPLHLAISSETSSNVDNDQEIRKHVPVAHLSSSVGHTKLERVVGRVWFKVKGLQNYSLPNNSSSSSYEATSNRKQVPNDHESICHYLHTIRSYPTVLVVFQGLSVEEKFSSRRITPTAFLKTTPVDNLTSLLDNKGGTVNAVPFFRAVALKCSPGDEQFLQMHLLTESKPVPQFSVSYPLAKLKLFKPYNLKFNQKWHKTSFKFGSSEDQENGSPNMVASVIRIPASSTFSNHDGLEVYIEPFLVETCTKEDIVLCLQIIDDKRRVSSEPVGSTGGREAQERQEYSAVAVLQSNEADITTSQPVCFFLPASPQLKENFKMYLRTYCAKDNSKLWWHSPVFSWVKIDFTSEVRQNLIAAENRHGMKAKFTNDEIKHSSKGAPLFEQLNIIVRWKTKEMRFLSEQTLLPDVHRRPSCSSNSMREVQDSIKSLTHDVEKLRSENDRLRNENKKFEKYVHTVEASVVARATEQAHLIHLTKYDLIEKIVKLSDYLEAERCARKIVQEKLQSTLTKMNYVEGELKELQRAHLFQQRLVRELQDKVIKYKKSVHICKQQDLTLSNLEKALYKQSGDVNMKMVLSELERENRYLRTLVQLDFSASSASILAEKEKTITTLQKEVAMLTKKVQKFDEVKKHKLEAQDSAPHPIDKNYQWQRLKYDEMKERLVMAEIREKFAIKELLAKRSQKNAKYKALSFPTKDNETIPETAEYISYQLRDQQEGARLFQKQDSSSQLVLHQPHSPSLSLESATIPPHSPVLTRHSDKLFSSQSTDASHFL